MCIFFCCSLFLHKNSWCRSSVRQRRNPKETADLTSIQELVSEIEGNSHSGKWLSFFFSIKLLDSETNS